jgi:hypothetical protein
MRKRIQALKIKRLLLLWRLIYSSWDLHLQFWFKWKNDEGSPHSRSAPELCIGGLINDMCQVASFLLWCMVQSTWPGTCWCSQCGGFTRVPSCPHRILTILPLGISMPLSLPGISASLPQLWACLIPAGLFLQLRLGTLGLLLWFVSFDVSPPLEGLSPRPTLAETAYSLLLYTL